MVCRFLDGFDYYSTSDLNRKWNTVGSSTFVKLDNVTKRTGINSLRMNVSSIAKIGVTFDDQATWIVGMAIYITGYPFDSNRIWLMQFNDSNTVQCSLKISNTGKLELARGTATVVTDGESVNSISLNTWYYVEVKVTIADSIGANTCQVEVNGVNWINVATGQDMKSSANATADNLLIFNGASGSPILYVDDFYIFDGTGSENNDFAGDVKVIVHLPNGNGATSNFIGSDANSVDNYLHVDETDTDDDTSYVESSTATDVDLYDFDDLAATPDTIHAVQINSVIKKDDAGSRTMRIVTRPITTNYFSGNLSPSNGSYTNEIKVYDLNPETSTAWTESTFNATEFGIEIQA